MLDADLAELYGVPTKAFNQAVKRNRARFPVDFMFRLTKTEHENMRSQIVTSTLEAEPGPCPTLSRNTVRSWRRMFLTALRRSR
jgi:hypothetical protein